MAGAPSLEFYERTWRAAFRRARTPVEGTLLPNKDAQALVEDIFDRLLTRFSEMPAEAEFTSEAIETTIDASRHQISSTRTDEDDHNIFHDPEDKRYPANLNLDRLQKRSNDEAFADREWTSLDPLLRPLSFHLLQRKGITGPDGEDVYNETFAELARLRSSDQKAPIESISLFEEIVPLFSKMIGFRAIDWMRRRGAQKNQPNTQSSIEDLTEREDHAMQFEEEGSNPYSSADELSFDQIYRQCEDALTPFEWELVFAIHVSQSDTMGEILEKEHILKELGLKISDSSSKKRRILNEVLEAALKKLAICLQN